MPIVFIDNFRGFHNTFIPFKKVNFLMGENSTGKTSILSLLKFISKPDFLLYPNFNDDDIELGYFKDISNSAKQKYFDIASDIENSTDNTEAYMLRFVEDEDQPRLSVYRYIRNNYDVKVYLDYEQEGKIVYRTISKSDQELLKNNREEFFKKWVKEFDFKGIEQVIKEDKSLEGLPKLFKVIFQLENIIHKGGPVLPFNSPFRPMFTWIAPIRAKPKRMYEQFLDKHTPQGDHIPMILKRLLVNDKDKMSENIELIKSFGKESGMYSNIETKSLGKGVSAPFTIQIKLNNKKYKMANVGYGVSQILPLIVELVIAQKGQWISIQQPEVHLHPKAQASFGDTIYDSYLKKGLNFLVETHSEYTVNRFRLRYGKDKINKKDAQILFFEKKSVGNSVSIIEIQKDGRYGNKQPKAFKEFFINEELNLLEL